VVKLRTNADTEKYFHDASIAAEEQVIMRDKAVINLEVIRKNGETVHRYMTSNTPWQFRCKGTKKWLNYASHQTPTWDFGEFEFREKPVSKKIHYFHNGKGDPLMYPEEIYTLDVAIGLEGYTHTIYEEIID